MVAEGGREDEIDKLWEVYYRLPVPFVVSDQLEVLGRDLILGEQVSIDLLALAFLFVDSEAIDDAVEF